MVPYLNDSGDSALFVICTTAALMWQSELEKRGREQHAVALEHIRARKLLSWSNRILTPELNWPPYGMPLMDGALIIDTEWVSQTLDLYEARHPI